MSDDEIPRLSRLIATLSRLQSKRLVTATELSEKFDISVRTVYRDIRALEASGIPIVTIEGRGYTLMEGFKLPPVMFTEKEANALITAEKIIQASKDQSLIKEFSEAIQKIKAVLPEYKKEKIEFLTGRIVIGKSRGSISNSRYLSDIQQAMTDYNLVDIEYRSGKEEVTKRAIEPFVLYHTEYDEWILAAFCRLRGDFRAFRLDRIVKLEILDEHFEPHKITLEQYVEKYVRTQNNP